MNGDVLGPAVWKGNKNTEKFSYIYILTMWRIFRFFQAILYRLTPWHNVFLQQQMF
jgi:hypothetical protein